MLATFAVTLACSLAIALGARRYATAALLNVWFIVAVALASSLHHHTRITSYTWAQTLAWTGGCALWIAATFIEWLARGRRDRPQPITELPADTSRHELTPPLITFALIRALVLGGTTAIAYGANPPHGIWLVVGAVVAMQPSLDQAVLVSAQRVAGAAIGAVAAMLVLLIPASETGSRLFAITLGLEVVAVVCLMHGMAIRFWNYALYTAAIAAGVLILIDLPQPANYSAEGYRVLWTLCGVAIAVLVMLLASLLGRRRAKAQPQAGPGPASAVTQPSC